MNTTNFGSGTSAQLGREAAAKAGELADRADAALETTKRKADQAIDRLQEGVQGFRDEVPGKLQSAAAKLEDALHLGADRARELSASARERAAMFGDETVAYIRDEPVKSMLIAAAAGAALTAVIAAIVRSR